LVASVNRQSRNVLILDASEVALGQPIQYVFCIGEVEHLAFPHDTLMLELLAIAAVRLAGERIDRGHMIVMLAPSPVRRVGS
jgi:hypothetical protein